MKYNHTDQPAQCFSIVVMCLSKNAYEAGKINKFGFEHLIHYAQN